MSGQFFAEDIIQAAYIRDGYVIVQLCDTSMLTQLYQTYRKFDPAISAPFYCSNWKDNAAERKAENSEIHAILYPTLSKLMPDCEMLYGSFITKRFHLVEKIHPHIDWQFVEEPQQVAFNVWMPFTHTSKVNGGLWVVPGSHHWTNEKRGPNIEIPIPAFMLDGKINIPLKAGEAIIYDTRLIHGSYPNRLPFKRIALATIMVPKAKRILHHFKMIQNEEIVSYEVDAEFYISHCQFRRTAEKWDLSNLLNTGVYNVVINK